MLSPHPSSPPLRAGEVLAGKYRLVRPLGVGGMGQVWVARNLATGAEVAAKVLLPSLSGALRAVARFRREAQSTASLCHRGIVRIFDLVELDPSQGSLLLVMELLRGRTLAQHIRARGALSVSETLEVALPTLSALAHAHGLGIVHRDLKPENVFLAIEPDGQRTPKILDFGISKDLRSGPITLSGEIVGTISYMSPEQTRGDAVDVRSDVFAMGVLLYECLSGKNPFTVVGSHAMTVPALLRVVLEVEPAPLDDVPDALWQVIRRALAKRPDDRFPTAMDLAYALVAASSTVAPPAGAPRLDLDLDLDVDPDLDPDLAPDPDVDPDPQPAPAPALFPLRDRHIVAATALAGSLALLALAPATSARPSRLLDAHPPATTLASLHTKQLPAPLDRVRPPAPVAAHGELALDAPTPATRAAPAPATRDKLGRLLVLSRAGAKPIRVASNTGLVHDPGF